jgi:DHA1 family bicyclomycin/chloramphenicol resistance-like MFS transporter
MICVKAFPDPKVFVIGICNCSQFLLSDAGILQITNGSHFMKSEIVMRNNWLILLLAWLTAFPPIATSMYLPAIPQLQKTWQESPAVINLTLVGFFISYCFFLLIYGPLSDRFGRRRPLLVGIGLFVLASLLCALADSAIIMILLRVLQGAGAASASILALAISKDSFTGHKRGRVLAIIGTITAVAPIVAPIFGGWILSGFSWRWIFVTQALFGSAAWIGTLCLPETLKTPNSSSLLQTIGIYLDLLHNRRYVVYTLMVALTGLAHFAFIGGSADIYITQIGLSEQSYGYFFALNALAMMMGAFTCSRVVPRFRSQALIPASFVGVLIGGLAILFSRLPGPWALALPMAIITFSCGFSRPLSYNLVLEEVDRNAGAASSLLTFSYFMAGAFSMWFIALDWRDKIGMIGILGVLSGGFLLILWLMLPKLAAPKH